MIASNLPTEMKECTMIMCGILLFLSLEALVTFAIGPSMLKARRSTSLQKFAISKPPVAVSGTHRMCSQWEQLEEFEEDPWVLDEQSVTRAANIKDKLDKK